MSGTNLIRTQELGEIRKPRPEKPVLSISERIAKVQSERESRQPKTRRRISIEDAKAILEGK